MFLIIQALSWFRLEILIRQSSRRLNSPSHKYALDTFPLCKSLHSLHPRECSLHKFRVTMIKIYDTLLNNIKTICTLASPRGCGRLKALFSLPSACGCLTVLICPLCCGAFWVKDSFPTARYLTMRPGSRLPTLHCRACALIITSCLWTNPSMSLEGESLRSLP